LGQASFLPLQAALRFARQSAGVARGAAISFH
jgi:hypothetical protein